MGADAELTKSVNSLLGLKHGILFAGTSTRAPVLGLRAIRDRRCRVPKLPNRRISTLSPDRSEHTMLSIMVTTIASDSLREMSNARETSSVRSALVIMGFLVLPGKGSTEAGPVCRRARPPAP
jgi:hypothetical protein